MANEKILNTRIQLKYDSYEKWNSSSVVLKAGEIAIAHLGPANKDGSTHTSGQHPVLIKVGDNAHTFAQLPWLSALAADVYAWAKKENPDWNDFPALPIEVIDNGTGKFVTDVEYANNKITITRSNVGWADIENKPNLVNTIEAADASLEIAPTSGDVKAKAKISAVEGNTLELKNDGLYVPAPAEVTLPSVEDNAVAFSFVTEVDQASGAVSNSKAKLVQGANITLTQEAAGGDITITGKDWSGEIAALDTGVMSVTGKDAINATGTKDVEVSLVLDNTGNVTLSQGANGLKAEITAADLGLSNAMHFIGAFTEAPASPVAGDVYLNTANHKEYVYDTANGWVELGDEGSHALKTISITGTDGLTGGGTLESNREIKLCDATKESLRKADNSKQKQNAYTAEGSTTKTITNVTQNENGEVTVSYGDIAFPAPPVVNDGKFTVSGIGALTGSGEMTANQAGNTTATLDVADKGITTAKLADGAVGAAQTKAAQSYTGNDAEVWVFCCGNASTLV